MSGLTWWLKAAVGTVVWKIDKWLEEHPPAERPPTPLGDTPRSRLR